MVRAYDPRDLSRIPIRKTYDAASDRWVYALRVDTATHVAMTNPFYELNEDADRIAGTMVLKAFRNSMNGDLAGLVQEAKMMCLRHVPDPLVKRAQEVFGDIEKILREPQRSAGVFTDDEWQDYIEAWNEYHKESGDE